MLLLEVWIFLTSEMLSTLMLLETLTLTLTELVELAEPDYQVILGNYVKTAIVRNNQYLEIEKLKEINITKFFFSKNVFS